MIFDKHPVLFLGYLRNALNIDDAVFNFSRYRYVPDSLIDERFEFKENNRAVDEVWLENQLNELSEGEELAFHSIVKIKNRNFHIPMIDFSIGKWDRDFVLNRIDKFLPKKITNNLYIYDSGRSFHGYAPLLLDNKNWMEFLGRLLLVNNDFNIIDSRWIGHRLIGGYCSLRWSNNSGLYEKMPTRIKYP